MKKLILLLFIPIVSFGQDSDFANFLISSKYYEGSNDQLATMTEDAIFYFNQSEEEKRKWAIETRKQTRVFFLKNSTEQNNITIKKQEKLNSKEFNDLVRSKNKDFLNYWNNMLRESDKENAKGTGISIVPLNYEIIKSDFGSFNNNYDYFYTLTKTSDGSQIVFQNAIWIIVNNMSYLITVTSVTSSQIFLENILISVK